MLRRFCVLILAGLAMVAVPMTAAALSLDVEAKGGAGVALGSTNNGDVTGSARLAADGGIGVDLYVFTAGPVDLGISTGVEYSYFTTHSTWANFLASPPSDQTTDAKYNYVTFPIAIVGRMPIGPVKLVVRAGAFIAYFLSGTADNTYSSPFVPSNSATLDSSNTIRMDYGLHFTAGTDIGLMQSLSIEPAIQFDMGLTDTTVDGAAPPAGPGTFKDTLWSLTVMVGIKYNVL